MTFTEIDKLKALAIVNVFETSRPFGDPSACVVLNDGAGVSYGICQFTHRSGALAEVVEGYLDAGGSAGNAVLAARLKDLKRKTPASVLKLSKDEEFKQALKTAAATQTMLDMQRNVAIKRYLAPAIEICGAKGFKLPLSLAVVYDSCIHGSFDRIAALNGQVRNEKIWITAYIRRRHAWLTSVKRLKATNYRTQFFMEQIAKGNWHLSLPVKANGSAITAKMFRTAAPGSPTSLSERSIDTAAILQTAGDAVAVAADRFDRVDGIVTAIERRTDAAKSLWTTIAGTIWQAAWAVVGVAAGIPRYIWIITAITVAALTLAYLYRQISLGKLREASSEREQ